MTLSQVRALIISTIVENSSRAITGQLMQDDLVAFVDAVIAEKADAFTNDAVIRAITAEVVAAWNAKYDKPSGGIPKSDLASGVQVSLGKADTALQEVPGTYRTAAAQDVIDATKASVTDLTTHTGNMTVHVSNLDRSSWNAKYDKPSGGIPSTDMASGVQVSLGKADTALQEVPSTYRTAVAQDVIDAGKASVTDLTNHTGDAVVHVTSGDKSTWNGKSVVGWNEVVLTGTKIATITIDGVATDVYAPSGGGSVVWGAITGNLNDQTDLANAFNGKASVYSLNAHTSDTGVHVNSTEKSAWNGKSVVSWNQIQATGTKIATITIDGSAVDIYAPTGGGSSAAWGQITGTLSNQTDLQVALDGKASTTDLTDHTGNTVVHVTSGDKSTWNGKQDAIADLGTIRSGAALGATSIQPGDNVSELTNDSGFITDAYHDASKADVTALTDHTGNVGVHVTPEQKATWNGKSTVTWSQVQTTGTKIATINISGTSTDVYAPEGGSTVVWGGITGDLVNQTDLYEELENRATVSDLDDHISDNSAHIQAGERSTWNGKQSAIADLDTIRSGAAAGATAVQPAALSVYRTSADQDVIDATKATDTAVVHKTGVETINGVKTFGSIPILPTAAPSSNNQAVRKGYVDTQVATKSAVAWTQVQTTGTKIATINIDGTSTDVYAPNGGGGGVTDVQVYGTSVVSGGIASLVYIPLQLDEVSPTGFSFTASPNKFYNWGLLTSTPTIYFDTYNANDEFNFDFICAYDNGISFDGVVWIGDAFPTATANKRYQVSIQNGVGIWAEVPTS